jgi:hypothetical protein
MRQPRSPQSGYLRACQAGLDEGSESRTISQFFHTAAVNALI